MFVIVTKQIGIEADTIESALEAVNKGEGKTINQSAIERPQSGQGPGQGAVQGHVTGSTFQRTTTQPTPALNG